MAWRLAALTLLGGGIAVGDLAARRVGRRAGAALMAGGASALAMPLLVGERRWHAAKQGSLDLDSRSPLPSMSVVIAARDEQRAVPGLIRDLGRQDHREPDGRPCFDVVVIDDRSVDATGDLVRRTAGAAGIGAITRVVRRAGVGLADGKGAALAHVPAEDLRGDVIVVLDADARVDPECLGSLARQMSHGIAALSCPIVLTGRRSAIVAAQAGEKRLDLAIQRARFALGGLSEFRGNGIVVPRDVLIAAGGWRHALTEDLDLASRIALDGHRVGVARDVTIGAEAVGSLGPLWAQRLRWSEGALRRVLEHGPAVVGSGRLRRRARLDFAAYIGQLAIPGVVLGAAVGAVRHRRASALVALAGAWGGALGIVGRSPGAVALSGLWIAAVPGAALRLALRRGPLPYAKMEHQGPRAAGSGPLSSGLGESACAAARLAARTRMQQEPT